VSDECLLHLDHRGHAGSRRKEDGKEGVALGVNLRASVRHEAGTDEPMVLGEDPA
jgi:hypothetical protein